jgi:lipase (class 3)/ricin-type beta-trefoil lectin protein
MEINGNYWYHIVNANSSLPLEVADSSKKDGARIQQWSYNDGELNYEPRLLWRFESAPGGGYYIVNNGSGLCMEIADSSKKQGARCQQWSKEPERLGTHWNITDADEGRVFIQNVNSMRYLEIADSGKDNGNYCQQWDDTPPTRPGAQWVLKRTENFITTPPVIAYEMANHCINAYESKAVLSEIYAGDWAELQLDTFFQDNGTNTEACLLRSKSGDKLVLAFRGTQEAMDWWTDGKNLVFDSFEGSSEEKVGYGFYQAWRGVRDQIMDRLGEVIGNGPIDLHITGHSLGGALASIAVVSIKRKFFESQPRKGLRTLSLCTFGAPFVGNKAFRDMYLKDVHPFLVSDLQYISTSDTFMNTVRQLQVRYAIIEVLQLDGGFGHDKMSYLKLVQVSSSDEPTNQEAAAPLTRLVVSVFNGSITTPYEGSVFNADTSLPGNRAVLSFKDADLSRPIERTNGITGVPFSSRNWDHAVLTPPKGATVAQLDSARIERGATRNSLHPIQWELQGLRIIANGKRIYFDSHVDEVLGEDQLSYAWDIPMPSK